MAQLREKRLFLLDMDGTIYLDEQLFDGVPEFLRYVRRIGGRYLFLTNNSSRGVEGLSLIHICKAEHGHPLSRDYPLGTEICGQNRYAGAECGGQGG